MRARMPNHAIIQENSYDLKKWKLFCELDQIVGKFQQLQRCGLNQIVGRFYNLKRVKVLMWIELNCRKFLRFENSDSF